MISIPTAPRTINVMEVPEYLHDPIRDPAALGVQMLPGKVSLNIIHFQN